MRPVASPLFKHNHVEEREFFQYCDQIFNNIMLAILKKPSELVSDSKSFSPPSLSECEKKQLFNKKNGIVCARNNFQIKTLTDERDKVIYFVTFGAFYQFVKSCVLNLDSKNQYQFSVNCFMTFANMKLVF